MWAPVPELDEELMTEVERARALGERDFPELLEDLDAAGIDRSQIEFVRVANVDDEDWSPLASADVLFRAGGAVYSVNATWVKVPEGALMLGISTWFKKAE